MKNIFVILTFAMLLFDGCKKDFDPKLYGSLATGTFPSNSSEYELYMMELYKPFQSNWGYGVQVGTNTDGSAINAFQNEFFSPEWGHLIMFDGSSDLCPVFANWGGFWQGFTSTDFTFMKSQGQSSHFEKVRMVTQATKIIDDLSKSNVLSDDQKKLFVAEARMARGWIMYYLLHIYGPVPIILDPSKIGTNAEKDLTRPSRADFVTSIASDLRFAADNLPVTASAYGRFTKGCALTVLTRLYLNEKDFVHAESVGREILPLGYKLVNDYSSLFKEATEVNSETIWAVSCISGQSANFNAWAFYTFPSDYSLGGTKIPTGWGGSTGVISMAWPFYDTFDPLDTRRQLLVASYTANDGKTLKNRTNMNGAVIAKYPALGGNQGDPQGNDIVVCRYADVLLMLAEAINENSGPTVEAIGFVNQIRTRAGISGVSASQSASKTAFRDMLFIERGHELYFEGLRKMDLIRMGKVQTALIGAGKTVGPNYNVFPLPQYAIDNSKGQLKQNDGY